MTKQKFKSLRDKQDLSDLHYPSAKEWMWDYCLFLGKFTDSKGQNWDLGVHFDPNRRSNCDFFAAIVHDNESGSYYSGELNAEEILNGVITRYDWWIKYGDEHYLETYNRLQKLLTK